MHKTNIQYHNINILELEKNGGGFPPPPADFIRFRVVRQIYFPSFGDFAWDISRKSEGDKPVFCLKMREK